MSGESSLLMSGVYASEVVGSLVERSDVCERSYVVLSLN